MPLIHAFLFKCIDKHFNYIVIAACEMHMYYSYNIARILLNDATSNVLAKDSTSRFFVQLFDSSLSQISRHQLCTNIIRQGDGETIDRFKEKKKCVIHVLCDISYK